MDSRVLLSTLAAPSFTATAVSATQINLAWNRVAGATGYLVDIDEWVNDAWKQDRGSVGSGCTSYAVPGLSSSTTYYFFVGRLQPGRHHLGTVEGCHHPIPYPPAFGARPGPERGSRPDLVGLRGCNQYFSAAGEFGDRCQRLVGRSDGDRPIDRFDLLMHLGGHRRLFRFDRGANRHRTGRR